MVSSEGLFFDDDDGKEDAIGTNRSGVGSVLEATPQTFLQEVLEASREVPVVVDFWGPSYPSCYQLTPILEQTVTAAKGRVRLVKMNVEAYPEVARQLRITSVPAVMVFREGRPVDGFLGAIPERQVKEFIHRFVGDMPADPGDIANDSGQQALAAGDATTAAQYFSEALQLKPGNPLAIGGLARAHIACGELDQARRILEMVKNEDSEHESVVAAYSALSLAEKSVAVGSLEEMEALVQQNPENHEKRFDLALALHGSGRRSEAVAQLLDIVAQAPHWNEQAARKQLLELFEAYGRDDVVSIEGRKQLSALLFR